MPHSTFLAPACLVIALTVSTLAGCTNGAADSGIMSGGAPDKSDIGTAAGAIGGGILGYQFGGGAGQALATVGGALLGGVLGNSIGSSLDKADMNYYDRASQHAMESGSRESWRNPESGNYGTIYPSGRYRNDEGRYCREYTQTIYVDGEKHSGHGTACREPDGSWRIME